MDDDCDPASADGSEDPQDGAVCDGSDSDLCDEGTISCEAGLLVCSDNSSSTEDVCNGVDDDCDPASADGSEDPQDGAACDTGQPGVCAAGTMNCISGSLTCIANNSPSPEICDDVFDNDCDGLVDTNDPDCEGQMTCADYIDRGSCNLDPACEWVGNPNSGICQDAACIPDETPEATCDDGNDNDCDGVTDCADTADCGGDPACQGMPCNTYLDKTSCQGAGCTWSNKDKVCM